MTPISVSTQYGRGTATAGHPASRHGLPTVVIDGRAHGPAEAGPVQLPPYGESEPHVAAMHDALRRAGYEVYA